MGNQARLSLRIFWHHYNDYMKQKFLLSGQSLNSFTLALFVLTLSCSFSFAYDFAIARVRYQGGDWNEGPTTLPNFLRFVRKNASLNVDPAEHVVSLSSPALFRYPFLFMTGHGNIKITQKELANLRKYLLNGGFLYIDDDFGMDKAVRSFLHKLFPERRMQLLPLDHPIFHIYYSFPEGCPKIHEHKKGPPEVYGVFDRNRMMILYTYNTNISDGWESPEVHGDPPSKRRQALKMGVNFLLYALLQ